MLMRLEDGLARMAQPEPELPLIKEPRHPGANPGFTAVCIASSTGGCAALMSLLGSMPATPDAAFFITQHGPGKMLSRFAMTLQEYTPMPVRYAEDMMAVRPGEVYLAPGDLHMAIKESSRRIQLLDTPKENYVRPSADPLFRSAARAFGSRCIVVILTGLGRDGALGASSIASSGGIVLAQDPGSAAAPYMPRTVINLGIANKIVPLEKMPEEIIKTIRKTAAATGKTGPRTHRSEAIPRRKKPATDQAMRPASPPETATGFPPY
jgi:two-component system chemotaxis response regulator CheB